MGVLRFSESKPILYQFFIVPIKMTLINQSSRFLKKKKRLIHISSFACLKSFMYKDVILLLMLAVHPNRVFCNEYPS